MKKYELTEGTIGDKGVILHRIKALKDFGDVKAGDLGGWIEKEENLSHDGNAWVYDDAKVYGKAQVYGNAKISGAALIEDAQIRDNAKVEDHARISGNAIVCDNARVAGYLDVYGGASLCSDDDELQGDTITCDTITCYWVILFGKIKLSGDTNISTLEEAREAMSAPIVKRGSFLPDHVLEMSCIDTLTPLLRAKASISDDIEAAAKNARKALKEESEASSQDSTLEVSVKESDELKARLNRASLASVIRPFAEDSKTIIDNLLGASQQSGIFKASLAQYKEAADRLVRFYIEHVDDGFTLREHALLTTVITSLRLLLNEEDIVGKTSGANLGSDSPLLIRALRPVQKEINEYLAGDSIDADPVRESTKCTQDKAKKMSF